MLVHEPLALDSSGALGATTPVDIPRGADRTPVAVHRGHDSVIDRLLSALVSARPGLGD